MQLYHGSCHCGGVTFAAKVALDYSARCDCSMCRRRGAIMLRYDEADLAIESGKDLLKEYRFNTNVAVHYFCKRCGIYTFHKMRKFSDKYALNAGCLEGVDLKTLRPTDIEGAKIYG